MAVELADGTRFVSIEEIQNWMRLKERVLGIAIPNRKPCPFCGCEYIDMRDSDDGWFRDCQGCNASMLGPTDAEAITLWNKRTTP